MTVQIILIGNSQKGRSESSNPKFKNANLKHFIPIEVANWKEHNGEGMHQYNHPEKQFHTIY